MIIARFQVGQAYVCIDDERMAVVTQVRSDGREGLLRFRDTGTAMTLGDMRENGVHTLAVGRLGHATQGQFGTRKAAALTFR